MITVNNVSLRFGKRTLFEGVNFMGKIQIHYNIDNIDKENANYNIIYGEKSNREKLSSKA